MKQNNLIYKGSNGKASGYDLAIPDNFNGTLIYFIHGYKGYKNWGAWDLISDYFYDKGYGFAKCNLSHNGTTIEHPNDFADLEAFANNRYSYELFDINAFMSSVDHQIKSSITHRVLIGHSRGGGDVILTAYQTNSINTLITWAAISDIGNRFLKDEALAQWKTAGVYSVLNGRTKQNMPHYYSFYEDYIEHKDQLDILQAAKAITIPWAIIHGTNDSAVNISEGRALKDASQHAVLFEIEHANHVFGAKEPYSEPSLPPHTTQLIKTTLEFIEKSR